MITNNSGLLMQIISNINSTNNRQDYATTHIKLDFLTNMNILYLNRQYDKYIPKNLVFNLSQREGVDETEYLNTIYNSLCLMNLQFKIGNDLVLQLPIKFLWELKTPTIVEDKLYINVPSDMFFKDLNMIEFCNTDISFSLYYFNEIVPYLQNSNFSMICQVFINVNRNVSPFQTNSSKFIQQSSSIFVSGIPEYNNEVAVNNVAVNNVFGSIDYRIKTSYFYGLTRGLFISCNISELTEIKFYINNVVRIDYDLFFIRTFCVKISDKLLYVPFNSDNNNYQLCYPEHYNGSINFSRINTSILKLKFNSPQDKIWIHTLFSNEIRYIHGIGSLTQRIFSDIYTTTPSSEPIVESNSYFNMFDMSGNIISNVPPRFGSVGETGPPGVRGETGPPGVSISQTLDNFGIGMNVINKPIGDRDICYITHEQIVLGQSYMSCHNCLNNFSVNALITWLRSRSEWQRTCPTCRCDWQNMSIFINSEEE